MGRGNNKQSVDNNESQMPQAPKYDVRDRGAASETEFAQELGDRYEVERKQGFPATGVRRKRK
ncbi:YfhD family protein [Paenibacillus antri]|uniref:YfhD family protein n=1 Tax=Paenibacillus antri TaxID=2582848 RepID=A0A5R9G945_9BACL|nr:YfhD family protein [Paenibacillus antri]TLS52947.1 YfhD family protein [Paenibacillus antri]